MASFKEASLRPPVPSGETFTNTDTPLDRYRDGWKVFVVDKIWAGYKIYPNLPNETERKKGRAISEALADALSNEFGIWGPKAHPKPDGAWLGLPRDESVIDADGVEEIYKAMYEKQREEWYTYRVEAMEREWNGTRAKDKNSGEGSGQNRGKAKWVIEPQRAEATYLFTTIGEITYSISAKALRHVVYRQFHWSPERRRTFKIRESARRGLYADHAVYNNEYQRGDWRYWGGENPLHEGGFEPLTAVELKEEEDNLRRAGVKWEAADYIETERPRELL